MILVPSNEQEAEEVFQTMIDKMEYGTLYGKDIKQMSKEEIIKHFIDLYKQNQKLGEEIGRLRADNFDLMYPTKNILQRMFLKLIK